MYLGKKSAKFFPAGPFFLVLQIKSLSKSPYFEKPPQPWKIPGDPLDKDNKLTFDDLLKLDNSVTIHQRNLQILATEIFKVKNSLAPEIMTEVFEIKEPHYNLRSEASHFRTGNIKSTHYGIQSVRHLGPKIWNIVPQNIGESNSLKTNWRV